MIRVENSQKLGNDDMLSKALTCMNFFLYIQKWLFYTSHIDHFTPQHTAFEQSVACLSVVLSDFLVLYLLQYCDTLGEL